MVSRIKPPFISFFVLTTLLISGEANAQLGTINDKNTAKQYTPATPNVAQIQKYGDIPVNYSSGLPSVSIPVWTIKMKDFSWPVSLSYHSVGSQVSEVASNVGLGWVLNATSIISAKVIGSSDFVHQNWGNQVKKTLVTGGIEGTNCDYYNVNDQQTADLLAQAGTNTLPDIYYLNSPLHNNKFFLRDNIGYCMPRSNFKITYTPPPPSDPTVHSFTVIDDNGNVYQFQKNGSNGVVSICTDGLQSTIENITFYLTKIITYAGEELNFSYTSEDFTYAVPGSQTVFENTSTSCPDCVGNPIQSVSCTSTNAGNEQRLDRITSSTGEIIEFVYSARADLTGGSKLDGIKIISLRNGVETLKYEKVLVNSYFGSGSNPDALRLKLNEFKTIEAGSLRTEKYEFGYNATSPPDRLSYAVDVYGYYNGQTGNTSLLLAGNNRTPDASSAQAGILTSIQYPTGGNTKFYYEYNYKDGGNRILKMEDLTSSGSIAKTRSFEYTPANTYTVPLFSEPLSRQYLKMENVASCNGVYIGSCYALYNCYYLKHSTSISRNMYEQYASKAKFNTVKEYIDGSSVGEGGYTEYTFDFPKTPSSAYRITDITNAEAKTVNKKVYAKTGSTYQLVSEEKTKYTMLEDQAGYFSEASDSREKNSWGIQITQLTTEVTGTCAVSFCHPATYHQQDFKLVSTPVFLSQTEVITYPPTGDALTSTTDFFYEDDLNVNATKSVSIQSNEIESIKEAKYPTSYSSYAGLTTDETNALASMVAANNIFAPFYTTSKEDGVLTAKIFASYKLNGTKAYAAQVRSYPTGGTKNRTISYDLPTAKGLPREVTDPDGLKTSFIYHPVDNKVIATALNASSNEIFFDGFEDAGGWDGSLVYDNTFAHSGRYSGKINNPTPSELISHSHARLNVSLAAPTKFKYSGWVYSAGPTVQIYFFMNTASETGYFTYVDAVETNVTGKWVYLEKEYTVPTDITWLNIRIDNNGGGAVWFDDIRLHPSAASMTSYTYEPLVGLTSQADIKNQFTYYEYDPFGRLSLIRDKDKNVLKKFCYNYAGQQEDCGAPVFGNVAKSDVFNKNNCGTNGTGSAVTYTVPANTYYATSQTSADAQAQADVDNNGQAHANFFGSCTWTNEAQSGTFARNNCGTNGTGSSVTYTIAAGTYSSTVSLADANQQATNAVNAGGQAYANANAGCTWTNEVQSGSFTRNNCGTNGTGSTVTYTVAAGTYSSAVSLADANQQATNAVSAGGQSYANANAGCTWVNEAQTVNFTRNNCGTNGTGGTVGYTVAAGTYSSTVSLADANQQAINYANANGQAYANANAGCTWTNQAQSGSFTRNNCGTNYTGSTVTYTVAAGTYSSTVSLADANQQAINAVNANGQNYANTNGTCTPNCNSSNCTGQAYKCINGVCEMGFRVCTFSFYNEGNGLYQNTYHYEWSDGSWSMDYYDESVNPCF